MLDRICWFLVRLAFALFLATPVMLIILLLLAGCASRPSSLDTMQQEIQDCILHGGHPRLGPNDTVVCVDE